MKTNYTFTRGATNTIIPSTFSILGKIGNFYIWPPTIISCTLPGFGHNHLNYKRLIEATSYVNKLIVYEYFIHIYPDPQIKIC